jgi:hypothetical protein
MCRKFCYSLGIPSKKHHRLQLDNLLFLVMHVLEKNVWVAVTLGRLTGRRRLPWLSNIEA